MDVLAPEGYGEIVGGGERRETDIDYLLAQIERHDLPQEWVRMVSRSAPLRQCASLGLWSWARAFALLDM